MREIPILMNTEMVRALIDGRKTETRSIVKSQPPEGCEPIIRSILLDGSKGERFICRNPDNENLFVPMKCPYGQRGDLLWVRETHSVFKQGDGTLQREKTKYKADPQWDGNKLIKWKPSIFMPKDAARIWLLVSEIRIEQVQEISEKDAVAEGIKELEKLSKTDPPYFRDYEDDSLGWFDPRHSFRSLWRSIHGLELWKKNPWVWVIKFKVLSTSGKPESWPGKQTRVDEECEKSFSK